MKGKFTFKKLVLTGAVILFILSLITSSVVYNNTKVQTTQDDGTISGVSVPITLYKDNGTAVKGTASVNSPKMGSGNYAIANGSDIVKKAREYLGYQYDGSLYLTGRNDSKKLDCSAMVQSVLNDLNIYKINDLTHYYGCGQLPRNTHCWYSYNRNSSGGYTYYKEVGAYGISNNQVAYAQTSPGATSIYDKNFSVTKNNDSNSYRVNILKVNNPVSSTLRWYNYYDDNGALHDLPIGTIVISYTGHQLSNPYGVRNKDGSAKIAHTWICIGNLGTSDAEAAANKLIQMGILTDASQKRYVTSVSNSNYWLIESTSAYHKNASGKLAEDGVRISNWDPDMNSADSGKGVGTIWAYQIAGDYKQGSFTAEVVKKDRNTGATLAGAQYELEDRNVSPIAKYTVTTADPGGKAQLPVGGSSTSFTKTITTTGNYTYSYSIQETKAPNGYKIDPNSRQIGFKISPRLVNGVYQVASVDVYFGNFQELIKGSPGPSWQYMTPGQTIWYKTNGELTKTDPGEGNYITMFSLGAADGNGNVKLTTTYYNEPITGSYHMSIAKKTDESDNLIGGATFKVQQYLYNWSFGNQATEEATVTSVNGSESDILFSVRDKNRNKIGDQKSKNIAIYEAGDDKYDGYILTETTAPDGTTNPRAKNIGLRVYKGVKDNGYVINKVVLQYGSNDIGTLIVGDKTNWIGVKADDTTTTNPNDNYVVGFEVSSNAIHVVWKNIKDTTGQYNIKVKKIDAKTKKPVKGVIFTINQRDLPATGDNGEASYGTITIDKNNYRTEDRYTVREKSLGTAANDYYKFDEAIVFDVKKEYIASTKEYKVSGIKFAESNVYTNETITKDVTDTTGRKVKILIALSGNNNNTITITAENNGVTPGKFYLTKTAESGGTALNDTTFNIDRTIINSNTGAVVEQKKNILNGALSTKANGLIDDINPMLGDPNAYVYEIHETTAQAGYINVFKKKVNGNDVELAYIKLTIKNDTSDKLVATQQIIRTNGCTDEEFSNIQAVVGDPVVNQSTRSVSLNIKNPGTKVPISLNKFIYGSSTRIVTGGTFKVEIDNEEQDSRNFGANGSQRIVLNNISVGDHTLRVYELTPPNGLDNVFDQFDGVDGIRVDFTVNYDGTYTIKENTYGGKSYTFTPESKEHVAKTQEIEEISKYVNAFYIPEYSKNIEVRIYDPTHFDFELYKKLYTGKDDLSQEDKFTGTAEFKIDRVITKTDGTKTTEGKFNDTLPTDTQSFLFKEDNVKAYESYQYEITETDVSTGFYRNLINKKIVVNFAVDVSGNIVNLRYRIFDENGNEIKGQQKSELDEFIQLDVNTNTKKINLYIANMPTVGYRVRIRKVDENGNPYKRTAVFSSDMSTTTSTEIKSRDNISTSPSTGIAYVTEGTEIVERGATHTYKIKEDKAPAGCQKLDGEIYVDITFNSATTGNSIQSVNYKYIDETGTEKILDGLDVTYSLGSSPIITIYVPNKGRDFDFELQKYDTTGNLLTASGADAVSFSISRGQLRNNDEVTIPQEDAEDFGKMINSFSAEIASLPNFNGILEDGTYKDSLPFGENLIYTYMIQEKSTKKGYCNELENKQINLFIYTRKGTDNKPYIDKVTFAIIDTANHGVDVTSKYAKYVNPVISEDKTKVELKLSNPSAYKIRMNKTDLAGNPIDSAVMYAYRINDNNQEELIAKLNEFVAGGNTIRGNYSTATSDYVGISKNEEQVWKIYEKAVEYPYYNIFGQDKYLEVTVKMDNTGSIYVKRYVVKDNTGKEYPVLLQYIERVTMIEEDGDKIVNVTFKNPSGYKLKITKYDYDGTTELSGAVVKLDGTEVISGGSSHYEEYNVAGACSSRTFKITETSTVANHINVLEGKELRVNVFTDSKGNIFRSYKIMSGDSEVTPPDQVFDYVSVSDIVIEDGVAVINVNIINPLVGKFNVKLFKVDEDGKLIKDYSARFQGTRNNGKINIKTLDASTVQGVATIDTDVTINGVKDFYYYYLTETEAPAGYEKLLSAIVLNTYFKDAGGNLTINEATTKLQVGSNVIPLSSSDGQFVADNTAAWYIDNSGNTATIKIYIKNKKKIFDLALRKYITNVENPNKSEKPNPARNPNISIPDDFGEPNHTTLYYAHTKEAYKVEYGDIITYRIYVYNEGNVKGYASEITDYLEPGLEFVENDFNSHWSATKNSDGTTTVTTRALQTTLLNEYNGQTTTNSPKWYAYVEIQCKVTRPATKTRSYITDRAEITEDRAVNVDSLGYITTLDLEDIDSTPKDVTKYHEKDMLNYDATKTYRTDTYYPGYEDDDDKETVYIEKHEYEFKLTKTEIKLEDPNNQEELAGARFKIEELMDNGEYQTIFGGEDGAIVNKNTTISEPEARGDSTVEINKTYTYKITEKDTVTGGNYSNILDGKYIVLKTYMTEAYSRYYMRTGIYRDTSSSYFNRYGFTIYNNDGSIVSANDDEYGYLYDVISVDINNGVYPPQVKLTIPNEKLYFGNYRINLKKYDTANKKMEGVPFYINGHYNETDAEGMVPVSIYNQNADEDGIVNIDKSNVNIPDVYVIEENAPWIDYDEEDDDETPQESEENINDGYDANYIAIQNEIRLTLTKSLDEENEKYYVSNVHVEYNGGTEIDIPISSVNATATENINLNLIDGTIVPAKIVISSNGLITITATNEYIDGNYKLRLYKVDENNLPVSGIQFGISGESGRFTTDSNGYTRTITKDITSENVDTPDEYTITEYADTQGRVVGLKNPIKLTVNKAVNSSFTKYEFKSLTLTNMSTGAETAPGWRADLNNLEINDDSGRTVMVYAEYDGNTNTITVHFENPTTQNELNVKIKKTDATTGQAVNGVTFRTKVNQEANTEATTRTVNGQDGIAVIDQGRRVSSAQTLRYEIREVSIPSGSKMIKLTDYGWILEYSTKYDSNSKKYIIDESSISLRVSQFGYDSGSYELSQRQKAIAEKMLEKENGKYKYISVSQDGLNLELNVQNEDTTEYGLTIRKTDMENNEIQDARFTVKENGITIANNQTIAEFARRLANKTGIFVNTTYTYEIYEDSPADGYDNILENTYIELVVTINNSGNASATYSIKAKQGAPSDAVSKVTAKIQEYVNANNDISSFLESNGNNFTLNIPNPSSTLDIDARLIKFETGNEDKKVNNARFSVRKTAFTKDQTASTSAAISRFDNNTSVEELDDILTKAAAINWIQRTFTAKAGEVYYYELTEFAVPTHYEREFYSALIKVFIQKNATTGTYEVVASIEKIKLTDTSDWTDYNANDYGDKLSIGVQGTSVQVKWANELSYKFRILKKSYVSTLPEGGPAAITEPASGANFTIISSNGPTTLVDGLIHQTEMYTEDDIHSNTTYTYTIRENEAAMYPVRHYNLFKDMDIIVNVRVGANGVLSVNNSTIEVKAQEGKTVSQEALAEARNNVALVIDPATGYVDVHIANKQIKNTYDIKIMKVSDKKVTDPITGEQRYVGIPGIGFTLMGNMLNNLGSGTTGPDGTLTIPGIEPNNFENSYAIAEDRASAINAGVTPLNGWIALDADLSGITSDMDEDEIETYLNETNPDGSSKRFSVRFLDTRDYNNGATVHVEGKTIIIMITNRTTDMEFKTMKTDVDGTIITGKTVDDVYYPAPEFRIVNSKANPDRVLWNDELILGQYTDHTHVDKNSWYEYTVREVSTSTGYVNVTKGYDIIVHIETDSNGAVYAPGGDPVYTKFTLVPNGLEEPTYTINEILNNNWVRLSVNYDTETDPDTGDDIVVSSSVLLRVINPDEYKLQLNKKDKNGSTPLSVANIKAENIVGADVSKIYDRGSLDEREFVLKQIAHAGQNGTVHVNGDPVELTKEPTAMSEEGYLIDKQNPYGAAFDNKQTWRISETDVDAPYKNILKDKYLIVNTYYTGMLNVSAHMEATDYNDASTYQRCNFYVVDLDGNNCTLDYLDYIEVSTAQIDNEWTLVVTIKDPLIIKMGLFKKVDSFMNEPLPGANLSIKLSSGATGEEKTAYIENGLYQTDMLEIEMPNRTSITATINEISTVNGYTNILKGKTLIYVFFNVDGNVYVVHKEITGLNVTQEEKDYINSHIDLKKYTTEEGYIAYKLYIENPTSFNFDLTKLDLDGNNLDGTQIKVESSHSGVHMLETGANLSFVEQDVAEHEIITYKITEMHTADGAYVNKFEYPIRIVATVEGGEVKILEKWHQVLLLNGSAPMQRFDELEYFDIYVDPADKNDLEDGEMQTLTIKMENPPQIKVELVKVSAGRYQRRIPNTKFTIVSQDTHTEYTDNRGQIDYLEEIHEPGDYTIRVYEDEVASPKYVNVLENKYMQFSINVTADGTVTVNRDSIKFFHKDNDSYYDNDVEITGEEASKLAGYCHVYEDNYGAIGMVRVTISDPIKFDVTLKKEATDGGSLEGAEFEIDGGSLFSVHTTTDENGEIVKRVEMANAGVHSIKVTEIKPAGNQYDNILGDNVAWIYVRVLESGELELVPTPYGSYFTDDVPENQRYILMKEDGAPLDEEEEARIREFVKIMLVHPNDDPDAITFTVENPIQTKLDIIKKQYNIEGQEEELTDTRFTVIKNSRDVLLNNAVVDEQVELEEHELKDGEDYYDIYENRTNMTDGAYVNILDGKFIRVRTELNANGKLKIVDSEGNVANTFDIYETQHYGAPTIVSRESNPALYESIKVWAAPDADGIYVLNVKVINPITINVGVIKKQYGEGAEPIPNVSIRITSQNTGDHDITSTTSEEVFSEGNIKPGTYDFIIRENSNPNPRYVNVLEGRYAKANVTISKTGDITLNNIKYYTNNNVEIADPELRAILQETVYATIDKTGRIQKITFVIENPITLDFRIHKVDLANGGLEGATFNVTKYVGDSNEVAKGMTSVDTDHDGVITFEDGDYMKAGIYRYEITELKPAAEKYVNILDCYDDGSQYKVVMYLKLNLNGTTEYVKDAQGTAYPNAGKTPYVIVNRNNASAEIPDEVTEIVHKYLTVDKTESRGNNPDQYDVQVTNTPQVDIDVIKVTKDSDTNQEKPLTGTKFSAEADDGNGLFEDIPATQDKEYTFKNVTKGRHEFYLTESEGVVNGGYINVLEDRYVRVRVTVDEAGVMKIMNNNWEEDEDYFEIYNGQYNRRAGSVLLDRTEYAKIYDCVSVESVPQENGVYKLNLKVTNPERNYNVKLNKKVFGEEDINMEGIEFFIKSGVNNQNHQLTTDSDGNLTFEEKRVPVGTYTYYVTETNTSGPEFVNVLENNYIAVNLKVNQDGTIEIVNMGGMTEDGKYYILDARCTQIIDPSTTIVDDFVRVDYDNDGDEPELDFFIKDPERYSFRLVKKEVMTKPYSDEIVSQTNLNGVTFTTTVYGPDGETVELLDADTFEALDIATVVTRHMTKEEMDEGTHSEETDNEDGMDGVIMIPNILIDKTGTYTFVFHEENTDGLFKYLYKSHAEDVTIKVDITVEEDNQGRAIGYKVGEPTILTGAKYVDAAKTLTELRKAQVVKTEVINVPIRGNFDLVLNKLDKYTSRPLDGAEFDIRAEKDGVAYELYEDVDDLNTENAIIPDHFTVVNGKIEIENIRITPPPYQAPAEDGTLETFTIILTETKAPTGYMLLDDPIILEVTTAVDGEYDDAEYVVKSVTINEDANHGLVTKTFGKNEINIVAYNEYFDLALRKSIVSVAYSDSDEAKITEEETEDRIPVIYEDDEIYDLNPSVTTANYRHVKNHVRVYPGQEVIYCLRVYNEGEIDGYAEKITDHLPEGLIFLPDDKFNTDRGWTYDLTDQSLRTVYTTFLSKEKNPNNDRFNAENNLIKAMDDKVTTGVNHNLDFVEIEIKCKVSDNLRPGVILTNIAEITEYKAEDRTQETVDRDSVADNADVPDGKDLQNYKEDELTDNREDYVPGQEDDDDFEKLIVVEFDLALRKYITALNDEEILAEDSEAKYTDEVVEDTEDILGEGTASDDAEGTNEGANTNIVDESEGENGTTGDVNAETTGENPDENIDADEESDEEDIDDDNKIKYDREPRVNVSTLKSGDLDSIYKDPDEPTTALYNHTKDPVEVSVDDIVTYTLEVFNEGTVDGYASLIKDDIPEGVEFVPYEEGDGSVNDKYRWKMVDENDEEVTDPKDAKYIVSDYLSKDNETEENGNLIRAFDPATGTRLDSKYVQVQFRVICKQDYPKLITNYAQISDDTDDGGKSVRDRDSHPNEWIEGEDDQDIERIWVTYMDLALRKFITGVTDFKTGKTEEITYRIPQVDPTALIDETGTTAKYEHTKEPVLVHTNDVVIYTLRIYNEGSKDGYATQIKDDLPEGLEFLPDHEINKYYEWSLVDKNDKPVTRLEDAEYAVTNYLSKDNETEERQNLLKSFDYYDYENDTPAKRETPEWKEIKIAFKVTEPQTSDRILINEAQISEQTDGKGVHREDRDSHPNEWLGEDDEDIEKVRVLYFDLALRKWVTKAIVTQDGEEVVFETGHHAEDDPEDVVKVDLKKSKLNKVVVKFEYQIRITNEGEIDGYAKEIKDRIPEGLRFDPADNPTWTQLEENIIVTDQLKDTLLKPGESAEVTVVLTWINSGDNLGLKVNVAEISKDYNDYGTPDIDSTPDNNVWGEDDIDDAPVMLAVKTGNAILGYIALAVFVGAVIVIGARRIKKINEG